MQSSGMRSGFAVAPDALQLVWYSGLADALRRFEKSIVGGLGCYRLGRLLGMGLGSAVLGIGPFLVLVQTRLLSLWLLPALTLLCLLAESVMARWRFGMPLASGLPSLASHFFMAYALIRSGIVCFRRGGIPWRDTFYSLDDLREGQRVSFP